MVKTSNLKVDSRDQFGSKEEILQVLQQMSEFDLQRRVIEPLLSELGFYCVKDVSGPTDKGTDIVAKRKDFGPAKLYAIQVKKFRLTGKHDRSKTTISSTSMLSVLDQLGQAITETLVDPETNQPSRPDGAYFVTPFPISRTAFESAMNQRLMLQKQNITIVDGTQLVELAAQHVPHVLCNLSSNLRYRINAMNFLDQVPEVSALGIGRRIDLGSIHVNVDVSYGVSALERLSQQGSVFQRQQKISLSIREANEFETALIKIAISPDRFENLTPERVLHAHIHNESIEANKKISNGTIPKGEKSEKEIDPMEVVCDFQIDLKSSIERLQEDGTNFLNAYLSAANDLNEPESELAETLESLLDHNKKTTAFLGINEIKRHWCRDAEVRIQSQPSIGSIPIDSLIRTTKSVLVTGKPGGGKTTLLRRLACDSFSRSSIQPVFVRLAEMSDGVGIKQIVTACQDSLQSLNFEIAYKTVVSHLVDGKLRVFLDGLDELGSQAFNALNTIVEFDQKYAKSQLIVSCRDTFILPPWLDALHVQLDPFTSAQVELFIDNWFRSRPKTASKLRDWLKENENIRDAASSPLVSALLCSIHEAGEELPSTKIQLFDSRVEMLLGRWEKAKNLPTLDKKTHTAYIYLLEHIAFHMHCLEKKEITLADILTQAKTIDFLASAADAIVIDLVHRGLLEINSSNEISFGHLAYQEHLAARWIAYHLEGAGSFVARKLESDWWFNTFCFYSEVKYDIGAVVEQALVTPGLLRLETMLARANLTSKKHTRSFQEKLAFLRRDRQSTK